VAWVFFEREIEIPVLLRACSDAIGAPIEFDPAKVTGSVQVESGTKLSAQELWDLANRELFARGLTTIQPPQTQALRVVALADAPSLARIEAPRSKEPWLASYGSWCRSPTARRTRWSSRCGSSSRRRRHVHRDQGEQRPPPG